MTEQATVWRLTVPGIQTVAIRSTRQMAVAGDVPDMEVIFSKLAWKQRVKIFSAPFF